MEYSIEKGCKLNENEEKVGSLIKALSWFEGVRYDQLLQLEKVGVPEPEIKKALITLYDTGLVFTINRGEDMVYLDMEIATKIEFMVQDKIDAIFDSMDSGEGIDEKTLHQIVEEGMPENIFDSVLEYVANKGEDGLYHRPKIKTFRLNIRENPE